MKKNTNAVRNSVLVAILCAAMLSHAGCSTGRSDVLPEMPEGTEVRIYEVFGMDCPGCHGGLEKLVDEIPAVEKSEANWKEKRLAVAVKPGADLKDEDVLDAIHRANLTPGERLR
jgi:copper chaperone CopZ